MKRVLPILLLVVVVIVVYFIFFNSAVNSGRQSSEETGDSPVAKLHSAAFDSKVDDAVASYMNMKDAFTETDSVTAKERASQFIKAIAEVPFNELNADTAGIKSTPLTQQIAELNANVEPITKAANIEMMRDDFNKASANFYAILQDIGYEGKKIYWQHCPMAFDSKGGNWLSSTNEILNPYMGKKHPMYKSAMIHCGENVDSLSVN